MYSVEILRSDDGESMQRYFSCLLLSLCGHCARAMLTGEFPFLRIWNFCCACLNEARVWEIWADYVRAIEKLTVCSEPQRFHTIYCRFYNNSPLVRILDQIRPFHNISPCFLKIHFNDVITFISASSKKSVLFNFSGRKSVRIFRRVHKLRKAIVRFVISVRPSVPLYARINSAHTGRIFMKFDIYVFLKNLSKKCKVH